MEHLKHISACAGCVAKGSKALFLRETAVDMKNFTVARYLFALYERTKKHVDFFADSLTPDKFKERLIRKYLREDGHPFNFFLYHMNRNNFAGLRAQTYTK